jgi:hypothetical protein
MRAREWNRPEPGGDMKFKHLALGMAALGLFWTRGAAAQEETFGTQGRFIIAAERVVGYTVTKTTVKWPVGNTDREEKWTDTQFDFTAKGSVHDPFAAPRLAFDYFIIDALSLGGSIGYSSHTHEGKWTQGNQAGDDADVTDSGFIVAPRVGYCYMFTPVIGIWPRGGFTYWTYSTETDPPGGGPTDKDSVSGFDFSAEAMLAIAPAAHAAFLVGPTLDLPISGSGDRRRGNNSVSYDKWKITSYGLQAGIGVWF